MISRSAALFMEMGTGKTKLTIDTAEVMFTKNRIYSILLIVPLSLIDVWKRELKIHSSKSVWSAIIGSKTQRLKALKRAFLHHLNWYIINIDGIASIEQELYDMRFDMVIVDESTIIKNPKAIRTKKTVELFGMAPYKLILSGNPIPKSPDEIFSQYAFLDCGIFGKNYWKFKEKYFRTDNYHKITGFRDKTEFQEKMHSTAFRKTKQECLTLPPKIYIEDEVEMGLEQQSVYNRMLEDARASYRDANCSAPVIIAKMIRLSQIAGGFLTGENGKVAEIRDNRKIKHILEILDELPATEQVVVWARFVPEIELLKRELTKAGYRNVCFYGAVSHEDRIKARDAFRERRARVFIGNPATGGRGLNDLIGATTVIYYSNDYSAENRIQSEDRNHRHGTIKVTYIDIIAKNTIDSAVLQVLKNNKNFSEMLLNRQIIL